MRRTTPTECAGERKQQTQRKASKARGRGRAKRRKSAAARAAEDELRARRHAGPLGRRRHGETTGASDAEELHCRALSLLLRAPGEASLAFASAESTQRGRSCDEPETDRGGARRMATGMDEHESQQPHAKGKRSRARPTKTTTPDKPREDVACVQSSLDARHADRTGGERDRGTAAA